MEQVVESSTNANSKTLNVGLLLVATLLAAKLISALIMPPRSNKRPPPAVTAWPVVGGLVRFMRGPIVMLREESYSISVIFPYNGMLPISVIFPYLPIPAHRRRDQARKKLSGIFARIIASRKQTGKTQNDLLQCFIDSKYKDGRQTTESEVTGLLIAALFAGQHTSSITSTWSGAHLLCNPKYMSAVVDEQKTLLQKHGKKVDYDVLSEMEALYRCIKEALRLHPPLIMLLRSSHSDFSVKTREGVEYDIPKGHIVATSPAFANRLPHIYKDPDTYDPDRFGPGRDEDKAAGAFSYISFGGGRHGCLGEPFAYLQIKAIWSHLLRNFEMELVSPFPETDWNAMVVVVRYKRRELPLIS